MLRWPAPSVKDSRMSGRKAVLTFRWVSRFTLSDDGEYICQDHKTTIAIKLGIYVVVSINWVSPVAQQ